jgi:Ca-activated chloride channel homolog
MPFISPLALLGLLFVPVVIAMYLLKLRRDRAVIPSTLLWHKLAADIEANAPWQKLRRSLLLLIQLLLVIVLALLAARPFVERPAGLAGDIVLVIDTSASMLATDVAPDRLTAAKQAAIEALKDLPAGGKVSVIAAGRSAKVVANGTTDLTRVRQAIESITAEASTGDLGDALQLASALAARSGDAEILVATDASLGTPLGLGAPVTPGASPSPGASPGASPSAGPSGAPASQAPVAGVLDAPVRVLQVGRDRANQAIVALAVRTAPSGVTRSVFVSVANLDIEPADRRLELWGDGQLLEAREMPLQPQRRTDVSIDDVPIGVGVVEVRLVGTGSDPAVAPDDLAVDDRAWAIIPPDQLRRILLVSDGDPYLETALTYLPNTELYGVTPDKYGPATKPELFDLIIFESFLPATLPAKPILAIAPPKDSDLGDVGVLIQNPGIGHLEPDEPILRYVDLTTLHIAEARSISLPDWARTIIPGPRGNPLLYTGVRSGLAAAVLAFEPRRSDLPLQVAFPILLANITGELMGGSSAPADAVAPGTPVTLPIPDGATGIRIQRPDGSVDELVAPGVAVRSVTFSRTELLGVYTVTPILGSGTPASPSASSGPTPSATPSGSPSGSPAPTAPPANPNLPVRFAVDLFAIDESNIAPGSVERIERLGSAAGPGGGTSGDERAAARDELWIPIVLAALAFLVFEWAVYERDTLARFRRSLGARLSGMRAPGRSG